MKYADEETARRLSGIPNYPQINQQAVREMHHQVGDLKLDNNGLATRGLLIRHLVLPNGLAGTEQVVRFLAEEISKDTYLNLMAQYRPEFKAHEIPDMKRRITSEEYQKTIQAALQAGLHRLD
jgi:putative pyruvate formate lyase activating enzyme